LIYAELGKRGNLRFLNEIRKPRDYSLGFASLKAGKGVDHPAGLH